MQTDVTVKQLEELCARVTEQRAVVDEKSAAKRAEEEKLDALEAEMIAMLQSLEMTNFRSKTGLFIISHKASVKLPATPEAREKFFDYLKERGLFDSMIGVNSQTLNKFYKDEFATAKERGDFDFEIPGIEPPTITETLSVKKS